MVSINGSSYRRLLYLLLLSILPVPSVDGHGVSFFSVCRASDHFYFYVHTFTETLCIGNSLSSFGMLSFNFSAYDYALYFFIPHNMTKKTPLPVPHSIYYMSCSCHPV